MWSTCLFIGFCNCSIWSESILRTSVAPLLLFQGISHCCMGTRFQGVNWEKKTKLCTKDCDGCLASYQSLCTVEGFVLFLQILLVCKWNRNLVIAFCAVGDLNLIRIGLQITDHLTICLSVYLSLSHTRQAEYVIVRATCHSRLDVYSSASQTFMCCVPVTLSAKLSGLL